MTYRPQNNSNKEKLLSLAYIKEELEKDAK